VIVSHSKPVPQSVAIAPPPAPVVAALPSTVSDKPSPVKPPARPAAAPVRASKPAATTASSPANWRVIAYTYSRLQDAEKKAQHINTKYAGLQAEVFKPESRKQTAYLVALGGHMTREEAQAFQRKAVGRGMPRDTYIQNYSN